jgi:hypothetical protein
MNKKIFLTETDKKKIISEKERMIIETFAKNFNKIKRIDENEIEANNLNSDDQEILDDILSINENVDFNTVIDKIKNYAKKGLLNTAIVMSLLGNPSFTQAQKDQIQNITNIEQTTDDKELSLTELKNIIKNDDFKPLPGTKPLIMTYNTVNKNTDTKFKVYRSVVKTQSTEKILTAINNTKTIMKKNDKTLSYETTYNFIKILDNGNAEVMVVVPIQNNGKIENVEIEATGEYEAKGVGVSSNGEMARKIAENNAKINLIEKLTKKSNFNEKLGPTKIKNQEIFKLENGSFKYIVIIGLDGYE